MPTRNTGSGNTLESTVRGTLESKGFVTVSFRNWDRNKDKYGKELLLKHIPYTNIYGSRGSTEWLIKSEKWIKEIRMECKWQGGSGSVDEKFPYYYLNAIECIPENEMIIVYGGGGFRAGALPWLKEAVRLHKYTKPNTVQKTIHVFNVEEFIQWANDTFR
jgi:hypothetical protein